MTDKQYYKEKYVGVLEEFKRFPVWSREQVVRYLHISNDMLIRLSDLGLMNRFKVQQQNYYASINDKDISNEKIKRSIMNVDAYYRLKPLLEEQVAYFKFGNDLEDKSLISRNIKMIGFQDIPQKPKYYFYFVIKPLQMQSDFKKIVDTMIDLYINSQTECVIIYLVINPSSKEDLLNYLDDSGRLRPFTMNKNILYETITVSSPHIECLK